jgi:hypothetical protein
MATYRKKPVKIQAFQFLCDAAPGWFFTGIAKNEVEG